MASKKIDLSAASGFDLLPEMGFKPVNKYLPPRTKRDATTSTAPPATNAQTTNTQTTNSALEKLFAFADKMLTR